MGSGLSREHVEAANHPGRTLPMTPIERFVYISYHYFEAILSYHEQCGFPVVCQKPLFFFLFGDSYDAEMAFLTTGDPLYTHCFYDEETTLESLLNEAWYLWCGNISSDIGTANISAAVVDPEAKPGHQSGNPWPHGYQGTQVSSGSGLAQFSPNTTPKSPRQTAYFGGSGAKKDEGAGKKEDQKEDKSGKHKKDDNKDDRDDQNCMKSDDHVDLLQVLALMIVIQPIALEARWSLLMRLFGNENILGRLIAAFLHLLDIKPEHLLQRLIDDEKDQSTRKSDDETSTAPSVFGLLRKESLFGNNFGSNKEQTSQSGMGEAPIQASLLQQSIDVIFQKIRKVLPDSCNSGSKDMSATRDFLMSLNMNDYSNEPENTVADREPADILPLLIPHLLHLCNYVRATSESYMVLARNASVFSTDLIELTSVKDLFLGRYKILGKKRSSIPSTFKNYCGYDVFDEISQTKLGLRILVTNPSVQRESVLEATLNRNLMREAALISTKLSHPNIRKILEYGQSSEFSYQVLESLQGCPTLYDHLTRMRRQSGGGIGEKEIIKILLQLLDALRFAHDLGIIHRNLNPRDIILSRDQNALFDDVKLGGWHLAKWSTSSVFGHEVPSLEAYPDAETDIRDPFYCCPDEIASAMSKPAPLWDIYSLGCVAFECVALQPPFVGAHAAGANTDRKGDSLLKTLTVKDKRSQEGSRWLPKISGEVFVAEDWIQRVSNAVDASERSSGTAKVEDMVEMMRNKSIAQRGPSAGDASIAMQNPNADGFPDIGGGVHENIGHEDGGTKEQLLNSSMPQSPNNLKERNLGAGGDGNVEKQISKSKDGDGSESFSGSSPMKRPVGDFIPIPENVLKDHCQLNLLPPNIRHLLTSNDFVDIIEKMLEKYPDIRYPNCQLVADDLLHLRKCLNDLPLAMTESLPHLITSTTKRSESFLKRTAKGGGPGTEESEAPGGVRHLLDLRKEFMTEFCSRYIAKFAKNLLCDEIRVTGAAIPLYKIRNPNEKHITLQNLDLASSDALIISRACEYASFESFDMSRNYVAFVGKNDSTVELTGLSNLSEAVVRMESLRFLDFSFNVLGPKGGVLLCSNLPVSLEVLKLGFCEIGVQGALTLAKVMKLRLKNLMECDLSHNAIGDSGCVAIAVTLGATSRHCSALEDLNLHANNLDNEAGTALMATLESNFTLLQVGLGDNAVPDVHHRVIKRALSFNNQYRALKDRNNNFPGFGSQFMSAALKTWSQGDMFVAERLLYRLQNPRDDLERHVGETLLGEYAKKGGPTSGSSQSSPGGERGSTSALLGPTDSIGSGRANNIMSVVGPSGEPHIIQNLALEMLLYNTRHSPGGPSSTTPGGDLKSPKKLSPLGSSEFADIT